MITGLINKIHANGAVGAVIPFARVDDLKNDMLDLKGGEYHPAWLDRMVTHTTAAENRFLPPELNFEPRSLITILMPSSKVILKFRFQEMVFDCVVPPHYTNWEANNNRALQYISDYLTPLGFSAVMALTLPQKLLAVHSGLAKYGRNNICYNEDFGSHMQIMTYISDMPCEDSVWLPLSRLEQCDKCRACIIACPTGAIDVNRRLINSDRCITFVDELPGEFPDWLALDAHNSIIGCTKCQDKCPANSKNNDNVTVGAKFTEKETLEILEHTSNTRYSDKLAAKLKKTGISQEYIDLFPRNLAVLMLSKGRQ